MHRRTNATRKALPMRTEGIESGADAAFVGYYGTARHALLTLLPADPAPRRVLEVGCGSGANLAELKRRFPGCITTGLEVDARASREARLRQGVDALVQGDALDVELPDAGFDLIVLSHVLEHFADPAAVLQRALRWLTPAGRLLVALPNVRHASVLAELVFLRDFRYRPAGILDRTHLRFFTRRSAVRLFEEQGLVVERWAPDVQGLKSRLVLWCSLGMARDLAAYAHNFLLRRP